MTTSVTTCQTCAGWGVTGEPGALITCQTCQGAGSWLLDDASQQFTYPFPSLLTPRSAQHATLVRALRYVLVIGALILTLTCFLLIVMETKSFSALIWQRDWLHVGFGLGGILSMVAFSLFEKRRGSQKSLADLKPDGGAVNLDEYAHARLGELINDAGQIALSLRDDTITDSTFLAALVVQPRVQSMVARLEHVPEDVMVAARSFLATGTAETPSAVRLHPTVKEAAPATTSPKGTGSIS